MTIIKKNYLRHKGIAGAIGVVFSQGFEALILPLLLFVPIMFSMSQDNGVAYSAGLMSFKELLSLTLIAIYLGPKIFMSAIKILINPKKRMFVLSGIFGTALGNIMFIVAIVLSGPSHGVILTAFYPVFAIALNKIAFKEKDNWISKIGIFIAVISGALFVGLPSIVERGYKLDMKTMGGMICGLMAGFFWALEGLLLKKAMIKFPTVTIKEIIAVRTMTVSLTSIIIFLPIAMGINMLIEHNHFNIYSDFIANIFTDPKAWIIWLILFIAGLNILILRIMHTTAIKYIGQKLTSIIDTNNFIVPPLFALIMQFIPGKPGEVFQQDLLAPYLWFLLVPISIGLFLVLMYHGVTSVPTLKQIWNKFFEKIKKQKQK